MILCGIFHIFQNHWKKTLEWQNKTRSFLKKLHKQNSLSPEEIEIYEEYESDLKNRRNQSDAVLQKRSNFVKDYREEVKREKAANAAAKEARAQKQEYKKSCLGKLSACFGNNSNSNNN